MANLNTDIETYVFDDWDLERVVNNLKPEDRQVTILMLMGFYQKEIANIIGIKRSAISKRQSNIKKLLCSRLAG